MPYVERDQNGYVKGQYAVLQPGYAEEWLDDGHPDLSIKTPEQLAEEARRALVAAAKDEAKADAIVQYLRDHTLTECADYAETLTNAQFRRGVAKVLSVLAKESLR